MVEYQSTFHQNNRGIILTEGLSAFVLLKINFPSTLFFYIDVETKKLQRESQIKTVS